MYCIASVSKPGVQLPLADKRTSRGIPVDRPFQTAYRNRDNGYEAQRYPQSMIKTFHSGETEKIRNGFRSKRLPQDIQQIARRKLRMFNNARSLNDLRIPPANRLEALKGSRSGKHSIRINDHWRICFVWMDGDAVNVEIVDYH